MIFPDKIQSITQSISKNGLRKTISMLIQYARIKQSREHIFNLKFDEFFGDILLRPKTSDFSTFRQVFFNNEYDFDFPGTPRVIVDAGANIGLASLYFLKRFPDAKIFSLEPDQSNFEMLLLNTNKHSQIIPLNCAIWNENKPLEIIDNGFDKWGMQVGPNLGNSSSSIQGISMDYLMSTNNIQQIDLLKIDIEGAELELFSNNFERWLPFVKVLVIELHEHLRPGCSSIFKNAIKKIPHRLAQCGENIIVYNLDLN